MGGRPGRPGIFRLRKYVLSAFTQLPLDIIYPSIHLHLHPCQPTFPVLVLLQQSSNTQNKAPLVLNHACELLRLKNMLWLISSQVASRGLLKLIMCRMKVSTTDSILSASMGRKGGLWADPQFYCTQQTAEKTGKECPSQPSFRGTLCSSRRMRGKLGMWRW